MKGSIKIFSYPIVLLLFLACGHNEVDTEQIHVVSDSVSVESSEKGAAGSRKETQRPIDKSPVLTKSFRFESEEVRSVDLTIPAVSDIFLSGFDSEIKSGGPAVFYQPSADSNPDHALAGQLVVPVEESTLKLVHVSAEKLPDWVGRCEIMVMYHLECAGDSGKTMGYLTEDDDMVSGHLGKGIVVNYICPGIYQAAYNCGSEKMGQGKSVKVTLSPQELKDKALENTEEGNQTVIDMAAIQESEVKDSDEVLAGVYRRIRQAVEMLAEAKNSDSRENILENLEDLAEKTKQELAKSNDQIAELKSQIQDIEENDDISKEDAKARKKLLKAKIKHLQKKTSQLKKDAKGQIQEAKKIEKENKEADRQAEKEKRKEEKLKKKQEREEKKKAKKLARAEEKKMKEKKNRKDESDS